MRRRLGIHVTQRDVHAVLLHDGRAVGTWSGSRVEGTPYESVFDALFVNLLKAGRRSVLVHAALGPRLATTRCIEGFPALANDADYAAAVRENAARYFIADPADVLFAARPVGNHVVAEAYDRIVMDQLTSSARRAGATRLVVLSSTSAVAQASADGVVRHAEDGVVQTIECSGGAIHATSRQPKADDGTDTPAHFPTNRALLALEPKFRMAAAAALADLASTPTHLALGAPRGISPAWRARLATGVTVASGVLLVASPVLSYRAQAATASEELRSLASSYTTAAEMRGRVARASAALSAIGAFSRAPATATRALAEINRVLPDDAALVGFAMDTTGGSIVVVAERIVAAVGALDDARGIAAPELSGPITRERLGDVEIERATVRFRWSEQ